MRWTKERVEGIILEMVNENPLAARPVLRLLGVRFTDKVPTLGVTLTDPPELLINAEFIRRHCTCEAHLKSAVFHEFLHIALGHTKRFNRLSMVENLALDAVINAMIFRLFGDEYSSLFEYYYQKEIGVAKLLRPMSSDEKLAIRQRQHNRRGLMKNRDMRTSFERFWDSLYAGEVGSEDVLELAQTMSGNRLSSGRFLIGRHKGDEKLSERVGEALENFHRQFEQRGFSNAANPGKLEGYEALQNAGSYGPQMDLWKSRVLSMLKRALSPERPESFPLRVGEICRLPILSARDLRAAVRCQWNPFLPVAEHEQTRQVPSAAATVYLDVSGSMRPEMEAAVHLLNHCRKLIRMPFWAFSETVAPAVFSNRKLLAQSTGGTDIDCVLAHISKTKPARAVVFSDGYISRFDAGLVEACSATRLMAIVTGQGSSGQLERAGFECIQLDSLPDKCSP
jgi:predicted metal-dependent peptidase